VRKDDLHALAQERADGAPPRGRRLVVVDDDEGRVGSEPGPDPRSRPAR